MRIKGTAICVVAMAMAAAVQANPITGSISMNGLAVLDNPDLNSAKTVEGWNNVYVGDDSGDFSSIALNIYNVTLSSPWLFNPYGPPFNSSNPQFTWSVDGFTFTMISDSVSVDPSGDFMDVLGYGTITSTNPSFDPTAYSWNFSTQTPPTGNAPDQFAFSATTIPDGGSTIAFLGLAFASLEGLRRKLSTSK